MNTTLELTSPETGLAIPNKPVDVNSLDTAKPLVEIFAPYQTTLEKWEAKVQSLVVFDVGQVTEMKQARLARLELRAARIGMDKTRLGLVENLKARTSKIDGTARIIREKIEGLEAILLESEEFAERYAEKVKSELHAKRCSEVLPWMDSMPMHIDLSVLSESDYQKYLGDLKLLRQAKIDAAAKAEADRLAKESAEKAERERIAAENAKLKEIAAAMERQAAIEKQAYEAEVAEAKRLSEIERKRVADERAKEKAEADAEWRRVEDERQAERDKAEAERMAERKKAAAERAAAEAKASKDREALQAAAAAKFDRMEAQRLAELKAAEAKANKLKDELAEKRKVEAAEKACIEAERLAKEQAARSAAAAPDKAKLKAFAATLRGTGFPALTNSDLANEVNSKFNALIFWVEAKIELL